MKRTKLIIDDGCSPELVAGAVFDIPLGIPIIKAPKKIIIPDRIVPFSERHKAPPEGTAICFNEMDVNFADVIRNPQKYDSEFRKYTAIISPDPSLYRDAPLEVQLTNIYRNRAIGSYYQRRAHYVIPLIRWGNEYTYTTKYFPQKVAYLGVEKNSIVAIGTYGCIQGRENRYHFESGLDGMMETIEPSVVLVYGSMPEKLFSKHESAAKFIQYDDWTTHVHKGGDKYGKRK